MGAFGKLVLVFIAGLMLLLGSLVPLSHRVTWWLHGRDAVMLLEDPARPARDMTPGGYDVHEVDVRYEGSQGTVHVPRLGLSLEMAKRLVAGQRVPVRYLDDAPGVALFDHQELESPYGFMVAGLLLIGVGVYGYRLHRREQAPGGR